MLHSHENDWVRSVCADIEGWPRFTAERKASYRRPNAHARVPEGSGRTCLVLPTLSHLWGVGFGSRSRGRLFSFYLTHFCLLQNFYNVRTLYLTTTKIPSKELPEREGKCKAIQLTAYCQLNEEKQDNKVKKEHLYRKVI